MAEITSTDVQTGVNQNAPLVPSLEIPDDLWKEIEEDFKTDPNEESDPATSNDQNPGNNERKDEDEPIEKETQESQKDSKIDQKRTKTGEQKGDPRLTDLYNFYHEQGYVTEKAEEPLTPEEFADRMVKQRQTEIEHFRELPVANASQDARPFIKYARDKPGVTLEELEEFFHRSKPPVYGEEDLKDEETAEKYLRDLYSSEGYKPDEIDEKIELEKDRNTISREALREYKRDTQARQAYVESKLQEAEQSKEAAELEQREFVENFQKSLNSTGWNDQRKQRVVQTYTTGLFHSVIENIMQMPDAMVQLLEFVSHFDLDKRNIDVQKYLTQEKSKIVKEIKNDISTSFSSSLGRQSAANVGEKDKDLDIEQYTFANLKR